MSEQVRIVQSKDGWHYKKGREKRSEAFESEHAATLAARKAFGHDQRRNYERG